MNNSIERLSDKLEEVMREVGAYVWDISSLYAYFEGVTDLRAARGARYCLADMLSMITLAKLGGEQETVYGLTSLSPEQADPARLLDLKRGYWAIENKLHYRRDVSLNEDRCRLKTGHAPRTMAIINNLALALIDRLDFNSVPNARRRIAAKPEQALSLFFQPFAQLTLQCPWLVRSCVVVASPTVTKVTEKSGHLSLISNPEQLILYI